VLLRVDVVPDAVVETTGVRFPIAGETGGGEAVATCSTGSGAVVTEVATSV